MADSVLNITSTNATAGVNFSVSSPNGNFAASSASTAAGFSIYTTNGDGYTLRLKSVDNNTNLTSNNEDNDFSFTSIAEITSQTDFAANTTEANTAFNGKWGLIPSKYVVDDTVITNTDNVLPAPGEESLVLDITETANGGTAEAAANNANDYTVGIGIRANYDVPIGAYTNTFVMEVVANIIIRNTIDYVGFSNTTGLPTLAEDIVNNTITLNNQPYNVEITAGGATLVSGTDYTYNNATGVITFTDTQESSLVINAVYSITYNLNGGVNNASNPATYDASDLPITLQDATRAGSYAFAGWYETSDFSSTQVISISNRYENITLYAKWESSIKKYSADCLTSLTSTGSFNTNKANIDEINSWTIKYKTYERYGSTEANPITSDEWLLIYVGPNTDADTGPQDGENHIVLMTKYIANNIKYYSSTVTNRSTANTYAANKDNWGMYTLNSNDYAYGTIKSVRANSSATDIWAEVNYRWYVGFGLFKYSSDDTYSRADYYAFGNNQSISRSGNSEYDSGIGYGTRPMVYLGTDKKITEVEDETYYRIIEDTTSSTCHALSSDSTNGVDEETE